MSDLFDDFNKIFKKDLVPIFVKFLKDPNNNITDNINNFVSDPQRLISDFFDGFVKNKDYDKKPEHSINIENFTNNDPVFDNSYDDLFKRLISIENNLIQIQKILKDEN
tara:strand:+ start:926 stop:1252 length:327 start_codon:yes stop_codon:yes gene_type:complete